MTTTWERAPVDLFASGARPCACPISGLAACGDDSERVQQGVQGRRCRLGLPNFELQLTEAPCWHSGMWCYASLRPIVVNSKDGRGPAVVLDGGLNGAFAAELVVRLAAQFCASLQNAMRVPKQKRDPDTVRITHPIAHLLPGWFFQVTETSAGHYVVEGKDLWGRKVAFDGGKGALECAIEAAKELESGLG